MNNIQNKMIKSIRQVYSECEQRNKSIKQMKYLKEKVGVIFIAIQLTSRCRDRKGESSKS